MPMDDSTLRNDVAAACREHDRLMARDQSESVQREGLAGLRYRDQESTAPAKPTYVELYHDAADPEHKFLVHNLDAHAEFNQKGWDAWVEAHLSNAKAEWLEDLTRAVGEVISHERGVRDHMLAERDRTIAELRAELVECKGMLTSALTALDAVRDSTEAIQRERQVEKRERQIRDETIRERSVKISELQAHNSASAAELARKQRDQELAQRDHRINLIEIKLGMLLQWIGGDLPRGFGRTDDEK
jgi:hypothetical protein